MYKLRAPSQKRYEPNIFLNQDMYETSMKQNRGCCGLVLFDFTWNGSLPQFINYTTDFTQFIHLMHQSIIVKRSLFDFYHGNCIVECCCRHYCLVTIYAIVSKVITVLLLDNKVLTDIIDIAFYHRWHNIHHRLFKYWLA